jgi:hypothetical protein
MIRIPIWYIIVAGGTIILILLSQWQWLKHRFHVDWMRYASEKARSVAVEARRAAAEGERVRRELEAENAELRGMIAAGRQALAEPHRLALVERRAR